MKEKQGKERVGWENTVWNSETYEQMEAKLWQEFIWSWHTKYWDLEPVNDWFWLQIDIWLAVSLVINALFLILLYY